MLEDYFKDELERLYYTNNPKTYNGSGSTFENASGIQGNLSAADGDINMQPSVTGTLSGQFFNIHSDVIMHLSPQLQSWDSQNRIYLQSIHKLTSHMPTLHYR